MIEKFKLSELKRILEIEKNSFPKSAYDRFTFLQYFDILHDNFLVHVSDSEIITGYIIFYPDGHIVSIAIDKKYRRKGIGTLLVKEVIHRSKNDIALVEVRQSNIGALNFYYKIGFKKIGKINNYYGNEDAVVLII